MKDLWKFVVLLTVALVLLIVAFGCSPKVGCPMQNSSEFRGRR